MIMNNFLDWRYNGKFSPREKCFDVGLTVNGALWKYKEDKTHPLLVVRTTSQQEMEG